jgi:hypothetical protein
MKKLLIMITVLAMACIGYSIVLVGNEIPTSGSQQKVTLPEITASVDELNVMDGVTATAAEINALDTDETTAVSVGHANVTLAVKAITVGDDVEVVDGGTGVSTLTDGGVLIGNGTGDVVATAVLTDGQMLVGDGTTDPAIESGATLRTSIGVGTGDSPQFTGLTLTGAADVQGGNITMEQDAELDNSAVAALGVTFPSASTVSNLGQLVVVSTDTSIDDNYVSDIAGLNALDSTEANTGYASIRVNVTDITDSTEDSEVIIYHKVAGANVAGITFGADGASFPAAITLTDTTQGTANPVLSIGSLASPLSYDLVDSTIPIQCSLVSIGDPGSQKTLTPAYFKSANSTEDQPNTQLCGPLARVSITKDVDSAYGIQSHVGIDADITN